MRVPMILRGSVNPYLAARAVLLLAKFGVFMAGTYIGEKISDYVETIAFPGLGTGVGRISPNTCARQVREAIASVLIERSTFPQSWVEAQNLHQMLYTNSVRDLQRQ